MKHPPIFKKVPMADHSAGRDIQAIQQDFEQFWKHVSAKVDNNPEKSLAMRKFQEACMWLTRAKALNAFVSDESIDNAATKKTGVEALKAQIKYKKKPLP